MVSISTLGVRLRKCRIGAGEELKDRDLGLRDDSDDVMVGICRNCEDEDLDRLGLPVSSSSVETARMGLSRWSQSGLELELELCWRRFEDDNCERLRLLGSCEEEQLPCHLLSSSVRSFSSTSSSLSLSSLFSSTLLLLLLLMEVLLVFSSSVV